MSPEQREIALANDPRYQGVKKFVDSREWLAALQLALQLQLQPRCSHSQPHQLVRPCLALPARCQPARWALITCWLVHPTPGAPRARLLALGTPNPCQPALAPVPACCSTAGAALSRRCAELRAMSPEQREIAVANDPRYQGAKKFMDSREWLAALQFTWRLQLQPRCSHS